MYFVKPYLLSTYIYFNLDKNYGKPSQLSITIILTLLFSVWLKNNPEET